MEQFYFDDQLIEHLRELVEQKEFRQIKELLSEVEPVDIAEKLEDVEPTELVFFFRLLPKDMASEVFELIDFDTQQLFLNHASDSEVAALLEDMSDDDRTELFDELPAKTVKKLLRHLSQEERRTANQLLGYPADSAGRIMTPEYIDLKAQMTAQEALTRIRETASTKETIYTCFVTDAYRHLMGTISLEDLLMADPTSPVGEIMDLTPIWATTTDDQEEAARLISRYDLHTLPVVDSEERLVGIITFDDVLDVIEEEATEDFELKAGVSPMDEDYLDASIWTLVRKRFTWLIICIVAESMTSSVLRHYSSVVQQAVALTFFVPLLIGTGGNSGTQSATLMVRSMTLGTWEWSHLGQILKRELLTGLCLGIVLGTLAFGRAWLLAPPFAVMVAVGISLACVVVLGNLIGTFLPLLALALKTDPAVMSGPLITTAVDVLGLAVYFQIARFCLAKFGV